jgi:hypothetical protein
MYFCFHGSFLTDFRERRLATLALLATLEKILDFLRFFAIFYIFYDIFYIFTKMIKTRIGGTLYLPTSFTIQRHWEERRDESIQKPSLPPGSPRRLSDSSR